MKNICILIPAYNPDNRLEQLVEQLKYNLSDTPIIIVNDGSTCGISFNDLLKKCPPPRLHYLSQ